MENLYNILEVNEQATQDEIKKSYRKLAMEHHPDKGGSEDKFKKISEAYEILGDENKRKDYDYNRNNPNRGSSIFDEFFSKMNRPQRNIVPDKIVDVEIGVIESFNSVEKNITYTRNIHCEPCGGQGGEKQICKVCNGQGHITQTMGSGFFKQVFSQICQSCQGRGSTLKSTCNICNGSGNKKNQESVKVKLPHGVSDGQYFKMTGKGDFINGNYGNLILRAIIIPEQNFDKAGNDLIYNAFFNLNELDNDSLEIPHPLGKLSIKLPDEFDTSRPLRVKSKGFQTDNKGDLIINLYVKFNRKLK